jgi:hypothetical protein
MCDHAGWSPCVSYFEADQSPASPAFDCMIAGPDLGRREDFGAALCFILGGTLEILWQPRMSS